MREKILRMGFHTRVLAGALVMLCTEAVARGAGSVLFRAPLNLPTGQSEFPPESIAIGDFNRDSLPDIAVADASAGPISVITIILNAGHGSFAAARSFPAGENPHSIVTADFDKDGILDLAVADQAGTTVSIWLGDGSGQFGPRSTFPVGVPGAAGLAASDFNADGHVDLAASLFTNRGENGGRNLAILLGNASGGFGAPNPFSAGEYPIEVIVADWNRDGKPDLAVANFNSANDPNGNTISVHLGDGSGGFPSMVEYPLGPNPQSVAAGDFNGDGKLDFAAVHSGSHPGGGGGGAILIGNGDGTFVRGFTLPLDSSNEAGQPDSVASADLNGDGFLDLAVARTGAISDVLVFLGDGTGRFMAPVSFQAGLAPQMVRVADFNSDGRPDLAIANGRSFDVSILFNDSFFDVVDVPVSTLSTAVVLAVGLICAALWLIRRPV